MIPYQSQVHSGLDIMCDKSSPMLIVKDPLEILVYLCATVKGVSFISLAKFQCGY